MREAKKRTRRDGEPVMGEKVPRRGRTAVEGN
jgi:hypothetical protein